MTKYNKLNKFLISSLISLFYISSSFLGTAVVGSQDPVNPGGSSNSNEMSAQDMYNKHEALNLEYNGQTYKYSRVSIRIISRGDWIWSTPSDTPGNLPDNVLLDKEQDKPNVIKYCFIFQYTPDPKGPRVIVHYEYHTDTKQAEMVNTTAPNMDDAHSAKFLKTRKVDTFQCTEWATSIGKQLTE